ncbi:MAG: ABC transporter ATP-binding protein [Armatimonadetes bacterium]|nr:ABC transporter ATP-binding protein [Anaerolineae bacterium]
MVTNTLTKHYAKGKTALDGLNLSVRQGEIFGYLGPNGAGKTTTIRMLMDFIRPSAGSAQVFGLDAQQHSIAIHQRIGFLPGELNLWQNQTALNVVRYFASVRGGVDLRYAHTLAERLQFDMSKRVRDYSTGNKRKLGLVLALMHQPELLILDEPTSGLDPLMQQIFIELMREWRDAGRTVFLSSHVLGEVQAICDRVAILRDGVLQAVESVTKLTHVDFKWVTLRFRDGAPLGHLAGVPGISEVHAEADTIKLRLSGDFDPLLRAFNGSYIVDLHVQEPTLEEIFLAFYGNQHHEVGNHRSEQVAKERVS